MSAQNPLTQQQLDESFKQSYWAHAVEYGLYYYIAGRFAVAAQFIPVSATLLHHAVELLIKACLARTDTAGQIRRYGRRDSYGHSLATAWQEFKNRHGDIDPAPYDPIVQGLDAFEDIRYPDRLVDQGASISIGMYEVAQSIVQLEGNPVPHYELMLPQIDRLIALLFQRSHFNSEALPVALRREHAKLYLGLHNATPVI